MSSDLRDRLHDIANDAPTATSVPPDLLTRARRRVVARAVSVAGAVLLMAGVAIGAVRILSRGASEEPARPSVAVDTFSDLRGKILYATAQPSLENRAVDPSNLSTTVWPLPVSWAPIDWSRDGRHVLARIWSHRTYDLGVVNADGTTERITRDDGAGWGSFSPDGSSLVYADGHGLVIERLDTRVRRTIVRRDGHEFLWGPAWSPDGASIIFWDSTPGGNRWTVQSVNVDGSGRRTIVDFSDRHYSEVGPLEWSPNGSTIAFWLNPSKVAQAPCQLS